jgi:hypothetical protein
MKPALNNKGGIIVPKEPEWFPISWKSQNWGCLCSNCKTGYNYCTEGIISFFMPMKTCRYSIGGKHGCGKMLQPIVQNDSASNSTLLWIKFVAAPFK